MAEKAVAVEGCQLTVVLPGTGTVTITSDPSDEIFVNGKGVYFKEIKFKVENSNGGGPVTNNDGKGEGSIIATGEGILYPVGGDKAVLLNDVSAAVTINGHAGDSAASGAVVVQVSNAGQSDVVAL